MKRLTGILIISLLLLMSASADTLTLPAGLGEIGAEAFLNNTAITEVTLPAGLSTIQTCAFSGCSAMELITIPASVTSISADAFDGCSSALVFKVSPGSYAEQYAAAHGFQTVSSCVRRALIIGQCDYLYTYDLNGPATDVVSMQTLLGGCGYETTVLRDVTGPEMTAGISSAFAGATDNDISLVYYSGHGATSTVESLRGSIVGVDGTFVSPSMLRESLDRFPGKKVVIIDACYSGAIIGKSSEPVSGSFASCFITRFLSRGTGSLTNENYNVMVACSSTQMSVEVYTGINYFGLFTYALGQGCGYDAFYGNSCGRYADTDHDGKVSVQEAYVYARDHANAIYSGQTAQVWPANSSFILIP